MQAEDHGPAERIIQSLLTHTDHLYHGRPGIVIQDGRTNTGVRWEPVTHKVAEDGSKIVYRIEKRGKKQHRTQIGTMNGDNRVLNGGREVGIYRKSGIFSEVAVWFYKQIAEIYKLDNEFVARWASYAFGQEHRDLKVVLAAFLLVQSRKGDPVTDEGEVIFHDDDYRDVGEAMMLLQQKGKDLSPKMLLRIWEVLTLPEVAQINRELGFGRSARNPFLGRWPRAVEKWLSYREQNPKMLDGLVKAGFRTTVMDLARRIGYKPQTDYFFEVLRWKQKQAKDGRRELAIGKDVKAVETWKHLSEEDICQKIEQERPNWKRIVGLLPKKIGVTRAIMAAAIEAGSLSSKDLVIMIPTLEALGLLEVHDIKQKVDAAIANAQDMRAANIAKNVRSKELKEKLEDGADDVAKKVVEEVVKDFRIYFFIDRSSSMHGALERAKPLIAKFIQPFPLDRIHVATFNTVGRELTIKHASTKGVEAAFRGISASGGTSHASGVMALSKYKPKDDEESIFMFVGDEEEQRPFDQAVRDSGLRPLAFGFLKTVATEGAAAWRYRHYPESSCIRDTAARLGIPCFPVEEGTFDDPYAIPRILRTLIEATPVGEPVRGRVAARVSLVDKILQTDLLQKPAWAS